METVTEKLTFTNPRKEADFDDWPIGRQRCKCRFYVETGRKGERMCRVTENKNRDGWNKPKKTIYALQWQIVDGSDGKTYCVSLGRGVYVMESNLKFCAQPRPMIWPEDDDFAEYASLFDAKAVRP